MIRKWVRKRLANKYFPLEIREDAAIFFASQSKYPLERWRLFVSGEISLDDL